MSVTMQQIADIVGVSRGTVDRALHGRGRINPELANKIHQTAQELGYRPNIIGQALVRSKHGLKLGAILQSAETPTMQDIAQAMKQKEAELHSLGIDLLLYEVPGLDTSCVLKRIEELLAEGIQGLAITPVGCPEISARINLLHRQGIPVITLNSDSPDSNRLCFVGMDHYRAGQTAAWLTCQMIPNGGKISIISGHKNNTAHNDRLNGFLDTLAREKDSLNLLPVQFCWDRDDVSHEIVEKILYENPDLAEIYITAHGQAGVCQAIEEAGLIDKIKIIAYDLNTQNRHLLETGRLSFVIDQGAFDQGYRPLQILSDLLLYNKSPEKDLYYTDISIRTKYNIV